MHTITLEEIEKSLPRLSPIHHKGIAGTALMLCGSKGFAGAATFAAKGFYRCGGGIAKIILPESIYPIVSALVPEAVFDFCEESKNCRVDSSEKVLSISKKCKVILIGCGMGNNINTQNAIKEILSECNLPLILDADGLNALGGGIEYLRRYKGKKIITPHPGEAARLLGVSAEAIQNDREKYVKMLADESGAITLLKGHNTLICEPYGETYLCPFGNAGMGKGGSGDILAGMITAFMCYKQNPLSAAVLGVSVHALAGDDAANRLSQLSMMPSDILDSIPHIFKNLE